ncbi:MAG: hypothetical protein RL291_1900 [Pseudomonadota bacterium]
MLSVFKTYRLAAALVGAVATLAVLAPPASAQFGPGGFDRERRGERPRTPFDASRWQELETRNVSARDDRVVLPVGRQEGRHSSIRLRVLDTPLFVRRLTVVYGNGTQTEIPVRRVLGEGDVTEPIDLEGDLRFIREVIVDLRPRDEDRREFGRGFTFERTRVSRMQVLGDGAARGGTAGGPSPFYGEREALPPNWVVFGVQRANFEGDRDVIRVGQQAGRFDRIALRVRDNDVFIRDLRVVYGNGEVREFPMNGVVRAGYRTTPLDLDGKRFISEVQLTYRSRPSGRQQAIVEVIGERAQDWYRERETTPAPRGVRDDGWIIVRAKDISSTRTDNDTFELGPQLGQIKRLQLRVRNNDVRIDSVQVNFTNGERELLPVNQTLSAGQVSPPLVFQGRGRRVNSVGISAKSRFSLRGNGVVEIWASNN